MREVEALKVRFRREAPPYVPGHGHVESVNPGGPVKARVDFEHRVVWLDSATSIGQRVGVAFEQMIDFWVAPTPPPETRPGR